MRGLTFEEHVPPAPSAPNRADVACFVGFVKRRQRRDAGGSLRPFPSVLPAAGGAADGELYRWLTERGWTRGGARLYGAPSSLAGGTAPAAPPWSRSDEAVDSLLDLPVPIESWDAFDRLFDWESRALREAIDEETAAPTAATYLGVAVRSFFAQGGRFCYVVRVGDPWRYDASLDDRRAALAALLPGFPGLLAASPVDPASWHGVGHLFGLPDVSFLCLPDLADAIAAARPPPEIPAEPAPVEELFVECALPLPAPPRNRFSRHFAAPRADEDGLAIWAAVVREVGDLLRRSRREVQLVAAVPLPVPGAVGSGRTRADEDLLAWLESSGYLAPMGAGDAVGVSFASAFVQLAWPWVKSAGSRALPEELESPDAVLVGVLARHALERGSYRSAARQPLADAYDVYPRTRAADLELPESRRTLIQRVSLLGRTPDGMQVLSDVTTSRDEAYRQANVNRLVSAVVRAARRLGEEVSFESSGPRLWSAIQGAMSSMLVGLWHDGALRGRSPAEAFQVRCDRSTMSQRDLDDGRVVVEVGFDAVAAIERIRVVLAMSEGGTTARVRAA